MKISGLDYRKLPGDPLFACIGPITARTVKEHQVPVGVVAKEYTTEGLLAAIESIEFSRKAELI
jgi:uroporphyrinogen-III synthase